MNIFTFHCSLFSLLVIICLSFTNDTQVCVKTQTIGVITAFENLCWAFDCCISKNERKFRSEYLSIFNRIIKECYAAQIMGIQGCIDEAIGDLVELNNNFLEISNGSNLKSENDVKLAISSIVYDMNNLVRITQLERMLYKVLGPGGTGRFVEDSVFVAFEKAYKNFFNEFESVEKCNSSAFNIRSWQIICYKFNRILKIKIVRCGNILDLLRKHLHEQLILTPESEGTLFLI